ncbi:MAG: hypothetical protein ACFBSE_03125 [Prochloraceae cyanobacterium]
MKTGSIAKTYINSNIMIPKEKSDLQNFNAKAFEIRHSGELQLGVIPAGSTEHGASLFKIYLGVQRIGTIYQIAPNLFAAALSYECGGNTFQFEDPKIACNWLVDRYFQWLDGDVEIKAIKLGYKVFHNRVYIGFINYSPLYGEWVATSYPAPRSGTRSLRRPRFSAKSLTQHQSEFPDALEFIVNEYLARHSYFDLRKLTN